MRVCLCELLLDARLILPDLLKLTVQLLRLKLQTVKHPLAMLLLLLCTVVVQLCGVCHEVRLLKPLLRLPPLVL